MSRIPSDARAIAARELEAFRFLMLYADRQLLKQGEHVLLARRVERRGRHAGYLGLLGCAVFLLCARPIAQSAHGVQASLEEGWTRDGLLSMHLLGVALYIACAIGAAMRGATVRAETRTVRRFVEQLLPEQAAELDAAAQGRSSPA